jgi:hypothetical protein
MGSWKHSISPELLVILGKNEVIIQKELPFERIKKIPKIRKKKRE